jgi:tetratricopeptide (TPR) repeat protein
MRTTLLAVVAAAALTPAIIAAPRINFTRTLPPLHDIGADHSAVIYALGDNDKVTTFVDVFLTHVNRAGILRVDDALDRSRNLIGERPSEKTIRQLNREHPADVYLGINQFSCNSETRGGEGSTYDVDGARVKRRHAWIDATCHARIDVIQPATAKRLFSFIVKGEGTSPRVVEITNEERDIAFEQAARYAAISASEAITPRVVRESIELDDAAPSFIEAASEIDAGRLPAAREMWEKELSRGANSAPLQFDLAAVCEALGDLDCAAGHYRAAARIAPREPRYHSEWELFRKRNVRP